VAPVARRLQRGFTGVEVELAAGVAGWRFMGFGTPPASAAWRHQEARSGFEVVYFRETSDGLRIDGCTTAVEDGRSWIVEYRIEVDGSWRTRSAHIIGRSESGRRSTTLESTGDGRWLVDGQAAAALDGCFDVDLESSALTNAFPVHRLGLEVSARSEAPAVYVRAEDLSVSRLEQTYTRLTNDEDGRQRFDYVSPAFDFRCELVYDAAGLVLAYPGIATRAG
jgi:uncharacterized protein